MKVFKRSEALFELPKEFTIAAIPFKEPEPNPFKIDWKIVEPTFVPELLLRPAIAPCAIL